MTLPLKYMFLMNRRRQKELSDFISVTELIGLSVSFSTAVRKKWTPDPKTMAVEGCETQ